MSNFQRLVACVALAFVGFAADGKSAPPYAYYHAGNLTAPTPGKTAPGMMLMGGGEWAAPAFHWFVEQAGHGHIVFLRASYADDLQNGFLAEIGGATSVETIVFSDRSAASDPKVLDIVRHADGIFLGGGDQSRYVRFWKGTPLNELLDAHVRAGKPIGGTSAGLAILGAYSYGAMDGGSLKSTVALKHPLGSAVTLVRDFLHLPYLANVITDTHFAARERQGRLIVMIARLAHEEKNPAITGIGVDESSALCIDASGIGRFYTRVNGYAWLIRPMREPDGLTRGPFNFRDIPVTLIGPDSALDLKTFEVSRPVSRFSLNVVDGRFDEAALATLAGVQNLATQPAPKHWALAIHGGAGVIERSDLTPAQDAAYRAALDAALEAGATILRNGGSGLDAVEATLRVLEDDPLFNAGKGAVFTADGRIELDASIMDGSTRKAGAVSGVTRTKNPISLARAVMEHSPHVMLAGSGADQFSREQNLEQVDPSYFRTERRWKELEAWRKDQAAAIDKTHRYGTIGAVALDESGHLAAGTSTGGTTGKRWGRVGDSPIIGAGTYAADGICAVSATGTGEYFIRMSAARQVCDRIAWKGESVQSASDATIASIGGIGGDGGLIAMDGAGHIAYAMNTVGMYRGVVTSDAAASTAIYVDEKILH
ncbi:MAG TPA: isoaspartyl peptidase/L-asparaginase [Steroidobacteraceae bacterium]|nr:isoaspartyl peptidase/L-asparaginase [Steroidobacteraceae bacterium]